MQPDRHARPMPDATAAPAARWREAGERARLSGPGLRAFRAIADLWNLTERQRLALLGEPARSTYHQWMKKAEADAPVTLPLDTLLRISGVLGVHKSLSILFHDRAQALVWLKGAHRGTLFQGASPLDFMTEGAQDGIVSVRRYLDAWRGGNPGQGAAEIAVPTEADVVFL